MNYKEEMALRHFGVPGMKWGKRKGPSERTLARRADNKKYGGYLKNYGKSIKNSILHPIRSTVASARLTQQTGSADAIRRKATGFHTKKELRILNQSVDKMIKDKKLKGKRISGEEYGSALISNIGHAVVGQVISQAGVQVGKKLVEAAFNN